MHLLGNAANVCSEILDGPTERKSLCSTHPYPSAETYVNSKFAR